jgi:hypothetical protein
MLRVRQSDKSVVKLTHDCVSPTDTCEHCEKCYVDECVPAGVYRYGSEKPTGGCGEYFGEATVTSALGSCTRTTGFSAPTSYSTAPTWADSALAPRACNFKDDEGCSMSGAARLVGGAQASLLLVGLCLLARRRRGSGG